MSLTHGVFKVHQYLQKLIPPPYSCDLKKNRLNSNSSYNQKFRKVFRLYSEFFIYFFILPISIYKVSWLLAHWKSFTVTHVEQIIIYGLVICTILILLPVLQIFRFQSNTIIYVMNQACQLGYPFTNRVKTFTKLSVGKKLKEFWKDIFPCVFALPFIFLSPAFFVAPFNISYIPPQCFLISNCFINFCFAILYSSIILYGALNVLYSLLLAIVFLENIIGYTKTLCSCKVSISTKLFFCVSVSRFKRTHILIGILNDLFGSFLTVLIFVGILLTSCALYMTVKMYNSINIVVYLFAPLLSIVCFVIALVLTYLANIPFEHTRNFQKYWLLHLKNKKQCAVLKTCNAVGFQLGPYGVGRAMLGLLICDDIIRNTVTFTLLDSL